MPSSTRASARRRWHDMRNYFPIVPMVLERGAKLDMQEVFAYEGDYLGIQVDFFTPLDYNQSLRVSMGNHINDEEEGGIDSDFFSFYASIIQAFETYLSLHRHDGSYYESDDLCQDYHQQWARWLRDYADRLERHCLPYAWQQRKP